MSISNQSLSDLDTRSLIHPYTNLSAHNDTGPLIIERGEGVRVFDTEGKEYIEGLAGLWSASLGFSDPELAEAAQDQLGKLPYYHGFHGKSTPPMIELAARLKSMVPIEDARIFFANSGSEINDTVVKLIWYVNNTLGRPEKKKVITRQRSYHGVTLATASMTGLALCQDGFDLPLDRFLKCMCPDYYREGLPGETEEEFSIRCAQDLEELILREGADSIAAFFADPVIAGGGVVPPPKGYFERIQKILRAHDILFVADEVICGFGRTGNMFACETYSLAPDVITLAKSLSASFVPISAAILSPTIWEGLLEASEQYGTFAHGFTYSGHPVASAVALKTLEIYERRNIIGQVQGVAEHFARRLDDFAAHPLVGDVRRVGLLGGIEFSPDKSAKAQFDPALGAGMFCFTRCQEHGLIVRPIGDIIAFCPPLIITTSEIDEMFARFARALEDTECFLRRSGAI